MSEAVQTQCGCAASFTCDTHRKTRARLERSEHRAAQGEIRRTDSVRTKQKRETHAERDERLSRTMGQVNRATSEEDVIRTSFARDVKALVDGMRDGAFAHSGASPFRALLVNAANKRVMDGWTPQRAAERVASRMLAVEFGEAITRRALTVNT